MLTLTSVVHEALQAAVHCWGVYFFSAARETVSASHVIELDLVPDNMREINAASAARAQQVSRLASRASRQEMH